MLTQNTSPDHRVIYSPGSRALINGYMCHLDPVWSLCLCVCVFEEIKQDKLHGEWMTVTLKRKTVLEMSYSKRWEVCFMEGRVRVRERALEPHRRWWEWIWEDVARIRSSFTSSRFWELLYLILCMWPGFEQKAQFPSCQPCQWDMVVVVEGVGGRVKGVGAGVSFHCTRFSRPWRPCEQIYTILNHCIVNLLSGFRSKYFNFPRWCLSYLASPTFLTIYVHAHPSQPLEGAPMGPF